MRSLSDPRLLAGFSLLPTDLGQAPEEHIAAEVKQCEPRESEQSPEGHRDPSGSIGSDEYPLRRQRDFGAGAKVYRSHGVSSNELVAALIGALDRIFSMPPVLHWKLGFALGVRWAASIVQLAE